MITGSDSTMSVGSSSSGRIIHNGDHAEFEREHANTPPKERPDWPYPSFDAKDWAEAFCNRFIISTRDGHKSASVDDDVGLMIGWFANALMRGFDEQLRRHGDGQRTAEPDSEAAPAVSGLSKDFISRRFMKQE